MVNAQTKNTSAERKKHIDIARKLKAVIERGDEAERVNNANFLKDYKVKHNITDAEINAGGKINDFDFKSIDAEELMNLVKSDLGKMVIVGALVFFALAKHFDKRKR